MYGYTNPIVQSFRKSTHVVGTICLGFVLFMLHNLEGVGGREGEMGALKDLWSGLVRSGPVLFSFGLLWFGWAWSDLFLFCFFVLFFVSLFLFCFVLSYFVVFCSGLSCLVLFCFVLFCFVLFGLVLFCFVLFWIVLFCLT